MNGRSLRLLLPLGLVSVVACSSAGGPGAPEPTGQSAEPIVNGTPATAYPESALIDMYQSGQLVAYCSGSLIAPQVVLTAGHCVKGESGAQGTITPDGWVVTLPFNGGQQFQSTSATVYDWPQTDGTVDPNYHDIGLVFLPSAASVTAAQCPVLAVAPVANQSNVVNIGRIQNGNVSTTELFVGAPVAVLDGAAGGYPYDYAAQDIIESGDSGGPDEVPGSTPHEIVSVNSGGPNPVGSGNEILARVDLLQPWIMQQIAAHGGLGPCTELVADAGSGSSSGTASSSGSSSGSTSSSGSSSGTTGSSGGSSSGSSSGTASSSGGTGSSSGNQGTASSSGVSTTPADAGAPVADAFGKPASGCGCVVVSADGSPDRAGLAVIGLLALGWIGRRRSRR